MALDSVVTGFLALAFLYKRLDKLMVLLVDSVVDADFAVKGFLKNFLEVFLGDH
jgi:hypothetical protein